MKASLDSVYKRIAEYPANMDESIDLPNPTRVSINSRKSYDESLEKMTVLLKKHNPQQSSLCHE